MTRVNLKHQGGCHSRLVIVFPLATSVANRMNGEDGCSPKKETKSGVLLVKEANDQLAN